MREVDDGLRADTAYRLACEGNALLWRGDYQGARQLLRALARRVDRKPAKRGATPRETFHLHRQAQTRRARVLSMLLVPLDGDFTVPLRRAPAVRDACTAAWGPPTGEPSTVPLRELLGVIGAYEWQRNGVPVPALDGDRIHPAYGVFAPTRGEYVDLVARAQLPGTATAYDIGTGTGVLTAVLARRGVRQVLATDQDPRALECAHGNLERLGVRGQVELVAADLYPHQAPPAQLAVCNPPWLPAKPASGLENAVYDPGSRMLRGFLDGLADRLAPGGEGWLILSDLAEHLQLRSREELLGWIEEAGLRVVDRDDIRPRHSRAAGDDPTDPLAEFRAAEVTSLWRLSRFS